MYLNKNYNEVRIGKHLYDEFPIHTGLKQGDALSPLLLIFNCILKYAMRKVQENQKGLELNGTLHSLISTDIFNILGENINTVKKKTDQINYILCLTTEVQGRIII